MNTVRYRPRLAISLAGAVLLLTSCGGLASQSAPTIGEAAPVPASPEGEAVYAGADKAGARLAPGARPSREQSGETAAGQVKLVPEDRSIVYTAEMTVRAKEVAVAADRARQIVTVAGGHLATERSDASPGGRDSALLVFKIPPTAYPGTLERLGKELGTRESLQQNTEDVTEQVADVESRLKSSKAALDSLRTLLGRAKTIGEVLKVEREVSEREAELEALQARRRTLTSQTSMATLTLRLIGPAVKVRKVAKEPPGFLGGLRTGWDAFVTAVKVGLTVLGVLLPWLIVAVPLWLLTVFLLRRMRRGTPAAAPRTGPDVPSAAAGSEETTAEAGAGSEETTGRP